MSIPGCWLLWPVSGEMGSTVESDRKRRHFSTISPTAATAKKAPFLPVSEDKKVRSFSYLVSSFFELIVLPYLVL